jgi:hypothetical protein
MRRRRAPEVVAVPDVKSPAWDGVRARLRQCVVCRKHFAPKGFDKTCTPEHRKEYQLAWRRKTWRKYYNREQQNAAARRRYKVEMEQRGPIIKQCAVCGKEFPSKSGSPKTCTPEHRKEYQRRLRKARREEVNARRRKYEAAHREEINARRRKYEAANREKINARALKYVKANRDKINTQRRARRKANLEKFRDYERERCKARKDDRRRSSPL